MKPSIKNLLVVLGTCWLSLWIGALLQMIVEPFTAGRIYHDTLGTFQMHLSMLLGPMAAAFLAGGVTRYAVETAHPWAWGLGQVALQVLMRNPIQWSAEGLKSRGLLERTLLDGMHIFLPAVCVIIGFALCGNPRQKRIAGSTPDSRQVCGSSQGNDNNRTIQKDNVE